MSGIYTVQFTGVAVTAQQDFFELNAHATKQCVLLGFNLSQSKQLAVRQLNFICNAAGTAVTGPDALQVTMADTATGIKTITLLKPFASSAQYVVQATGATAAAITQIDITSSSVFVINSFAVDGTTAKDSIVHVTVTGSDSTNQY